MEGPWRNNRWRMYCQVCRLDELEFSKPKLAILLHTYGCAFDDVYYYYLTKGKNVERQPLWLSRNRVPTEKPRKYEPNRKLTEFE